MICTNCGQKLPEGNRFCENCGAPVSIELPKMETVHQTVNQQGSPGMPMGGVGIRREEISMKQPQAKKPAKSWIWIIVIALILLGCCCAAVVGGGFIYLRNQGQSWQDVFPDGLEDFSDTREALPEPEIDSPIPEEAAQPSPQDETIQESGYLPEDYTLAITSSGIWMVNVQTRAATQISYGQLDAPCNVYGSRATIWDAETGHKILIFKGHPGALLIPAWSPNGMRVATGDTTGGVKIWDAETGSVLLDYSIPIGDFLFQIAWSPDGTRLAGGAAMKSIEIHRVWQSTEELIDYAKECCVFRELTDAERTQFGLD